MNKKRKMHFNKILFSLLSLELQAKYRCYMKMSKSGNLELIISEVISYKITRKSLMKKKTLRNSFRKIIFYQY